MINIKIDGVEYFYAADVTKELGVARQTLWRWRQQKKIPAGHRYRDGKILFTANEIEEIRQFANRIEPIYQVGGQQLKLFNGL